MMLSASYRSRPEGGRKTAACTTIVTTVYADDDHLFSALRAGAQGYLLKDQSRERLTEQLRGILHGEPPLSPSIARRLMRTFTAPAQHREDSGLTAREIEVLTLIANGHTLKDVGKALGISRFTVGDHVKMIYRKLNVASRAEAALQAARLGIVRDD
jgi:DNA-binding NarL/FixJ family response regulator